MTNRSTARGSPGAMSAGVQADRHAPKQAAIMPSRTAARRRRMSVGKGRPDRLIRPLGGSERSERGGTFSREGPPRPTEPPPRGQRAERAWGDVHPSREGPPRPTDPPPRGQRAERAWGDVHPSREGPPRPTDPPPRGQRAERAWGEVSS